MNKMLYIATYKLLRYNFFLYINLLSLNSVIGSLLAAKNKTKRLKPRDTKQIIASLDKLDELSAVVGDSRPLTSGEWQMIKAHTAFTRHVLQDAEPLADPDNSGKPSGKAIGPTDSKVKGDKKKFGGQKGHKGANHSREPDPDILVILDSPEKDNDPDWERVGKKWGQTLDIECKRRVTEHRSIVYKNTLTGEIWSRELPEGRCGTVRVGNALKKLVVMLRDAGHLSYERIKQFIGEVCQIKLNEATLVRIVKEFEASPGLFIFKKHAEQDLLSSPAANHDETGVSVNGHNEWAHIMANPDYTQYWLHRKRGKEAMDDIGLLPEFSGVLVHDSLNTYFLYDNFSHALCGAHLQRELNCAHEMGQEWATKLNDFLSDLNDLTKRHGGVLPAVMQNKARKKYMKCIAEGYEATGGVEYARPEWQKGRKGRTAKPKYRNLLERLDKRMDAVLLFMTDYRIPFTNNDAERPIRSIKLHLKVAGCFRKDYMAEGFLRIRGFIDSCAKHNINSFQAIKMLSEGKIAVFTRKRNGESIPAAA